MKVPTNVIISQTHSRSVTIEVENNEPLLGAYECQEFSITELLAELEKLTIEKITRVGEGTSDGKYYMSVLHSCRGWTEDETEIIEDK